MWWAILWAFVIGEISNSSDDSGATWGAILAFFVIWYFIDKANQRIYIIMEYCEGGDLAMIIRRTRK